MICFSTSLTNVDDDDYNKYIHSILISTHQTKQKTWRENCHIIEIYFFSNINNIQKKRLFMVCEMEFATTEWIMRET